MIKYTLCTIGILLVIGLIIGGFHLFKVSQKNKKEMAEFENKDFKLTKNLGKVLVIYYSYSGKTKAIAEEIKELTSADIYEIKTSEPLPKGAALHLAIKKQLKDKNYPKLVNDFPNVDNYDTVFIGSPVWWYTIATPALAFLEKYDFKDKKVVPFSTEGSNFGTFFEDFNKMAKNANILKSQSFNNLPKKYDTEVKNKIIDWLNKL